MQRHRIQRLVHLGSPAFSVKVRQLNAVLIDKLSLAQNRILWVVSPADKPTLAAAKNKRRKGPLNPCDRVPTRDLPSVFFLLRLSVKINCSGKREEPRSKIESLLNLGQIY